MSNLNAQPDGLRIPASLLAPQFEEETRDTCWQEIVKGHDELDIYVDLILDITGDEDSGEDSTLSEDDCEAIANFLLSARRSQQKEFAAVPETSLTTAFQELTFSGILAEQDFTCCGTCGTDEIGMDIEDYSAWQGYVFYHTQDTDRLVEDHEVYINYGLFWPHYKTKEEFESMTESERETFYNQKTIELMNTVAIPTFQKHGIEIEWDGSMDTRIKLKNVDFYAPLP